MSQRAQATELPGGSTGGSERSVGRSLEEDLDDRERRRVLAVLHDRQQTVENQLAQLVVEKREDVAATEAVLARMQRDLGLATANRTLDEEAATLSIDAARPPVQIVNSIDELVEQMEELESNVLKTMASVGAQLSSRIDELKADGMAFRGLSTASVLSDQIVERLDQQEQRIDQLIGWGEEIESRLDVAV